jgi:Leucine-rich repeat (LRR) protein
MKRVKIFSLLAVIILLCKCEKEKDDPYVVKFNDPEFLKELIKQGIDKNGDGQISPNEAEITDYILIENPDVTDLKGIEAFTYLSSFSARAFGVTSLDLSENKNLTGLYVHSNSLRSINVANNIALKILWCSTNKLTKLDVSKNINLEELFCDINQLTILDLTNNKSLKSLRCGSNQLTELNISNNTKLKELEISNMPTLTKVCVWEIPLPFYYLYIGSPNMYLSQDCSK